MLRWRIITLRRKVPARWPVLMRAMTGSNIHIAMVWHWSAMLPPPPIPLTARGLSFALRAARVLRDELISNSNWDAAGHRYADQHQRSFLACHTVEGWYRAVFQDPSPESTALRAKAMPLIAEDPTRVPDHILSGPDLPLN